MKARIRLFPLLVLLLLLIIAAYAFNGCANGGVRGALRVSGAHTTVKAEATTKEAAYDLYLRGLIFIAGDDVTLTIKPADGPARVEVDCPKALVTKYGLTATIDNGEIRIEADSLYTLRTDSFHVTVYAPCKSVFVEGAYDLDIDASGVDEFSLKISGAAEGGVKNIKAKDVNCAVAGAANISLAGTTDSLTCRINGAGDINAKDLTARDATLQINGAGEITSTATTSLDAAINGAGKIGYYGRPADVRQQLAGAGTIEPLD